MRIIYLHQYFNTPQMFGGTRSYEMAIRFVAAGHEVHVITSRGEISADFSGWIEEIIDGMHVHWVHVPYSNKMGFSVRIISFMKFSLLAALRAVKINGDLIFATSTPLTIALPAVYASKRLGKPMVFEVRDMWPELPVALGILKNPLIIKTAYLLEHFAYKNSEQVIVFSERMAKGVMRTGYPKDRIKVIPNGCDNDLFRVKKSVGQTFLDKFPFLKGGKLVVYTGAMGWVNGVEWLVDVAFHMLKIDPNVKFLIAGDGVLSGKIKRKAVSLGVYKNNFWMIPPVPKKDVPGLLSAATVAVSSVIEMEELSDAFGNKAFDALAAGKPLVINHRGALEQIISKSGAGIKLSFTDRQNAANELSRFLKDDHRLNRASKMSRYLADTVYSRDKVANRLLLVFQNVLALHKGQR